MDDFTPYGSNFQESLTNLRKVLAKCIEMNLSFSPDKCEFLMTEGTMLGHTISQQGLQVDPNKISIIQRVPPLQKVRDVWSFLGLAGYYRRFIKDFSKLASPLFGLLGKDDEFIWTDNYQEALDALKGKLQFDLTIVDKPGKENVVADFLSRLELPTDEEGMADDQMLDEHLFSISVLSPWFADIANYLVSAQFPPHLSSKEKSKIVRKNTPFTWIGGNLFKLDPNQILRRCVREEEVLDILLTCHDGPCGGHFAAKRIAFKTLQVGYYWPTLHQDVKRYISQCDRCQRMGKPTPRDVMPLQPQVTFEPFEKWGIDFVGPINPPSKHKTYIIVCTDYLTKWVETKAIKAATEEKVAKFLRENIFYKFSYLRELVTDQGSQFTSNLIEDLLTQHKIKHRTSTPYHTHEIGQVEVTNRALEEILTKVVSKSIKYWADQLVEATWAYNTTWKTTTGFTLYELVYGKKALLSI
eukprot:PITA_29141